MKRANGTGGIVRLSGNRRRPYVVRIAGRDEFGHIVQRPLSYHSSAREAQAALDEYNRAREAGVALSADKMNMTVGQIFEAWSAREYRKLNPKSISAHNAAWKMRVSRFADKKMRSMSLDLWQELLDEDKEKGRSQSTINNDVGLIRALYNYSIERDIVTKDYSLYLDIPSVSAKFAKGAFTSDQLKQIEKLAASGEPWADTVLILCYTGFRISEFLSLTPADYHASEHYLQGGLKTKAGKNRIVPIHPKIQPYIDVWLAKGGERIICDNTGRAIPGPKYRSSYFTPIMRKIDAPAATPHWCRHTLATLLHNAQVDELTIKWILGHSTANDITAHYTHATISALTTAINKIA